MLQKCIVFLLICLIAANSCHLGLSRPCAFTRPNDKNNIYKADKSSLLACSTWRHACSKRRALCSGRPVYTILIVIMQTLFLQSRFMSKICALPVAKICVLYITVHTSIIQHGIHYQICTIFKSNILCCLTFGSIVISYFLFPILSLYSFTRMPHCILLRGINQCLFRN